ncbi:unnamed protein product [Closterium sp. Naga37s-1]|nr:unnamed protein product [Closterium sp. Naga37s-1]
MSLATLTPPGTGARPFVANASPAATVSHQKTRFEKQQQQQLQQQEEQEQEPLRLPPLFRLDRFFGSAPDSIWKTPGKSASNGEIGGAGEKKRGQADDAGGKEGGGGGGTWLIDPGDGTSGEGAKFPSAELFTARNFPVRLPRRKGKRRKGDREEDVGGKTNPGTVEGGSVGQDSNLTMLLGAEDDGVYDVDMRVTLYSPLPPIPCLPSATSNLTMVLGAEDDEVYDVDMRVTRVINLIMLLGAEDDGVYDVDMRVTLYRNWFDKSGQRQPKARDGSWMEGKGWSGGGMDGVMDGERQWNGRLGGEMEAWRDG